jgi:hypothetical protein
MKNGCTFRFFVTSFWSLVARYVKFRRQVHHKLKKKSPYSLSFNIFKSCPTSPNHWNNLFIFRFRSAGTTIFPFCPSYFLSYFLSCFIFLLFQIFLSAILSFTLPSSFVLYFLVSASLSLFFPLLLPLFKTLYLNIFLYFAILSFCFPYFLLSLIFSFTVLPPFLSLSYSISFPLFLSLFFLL